MSRRYKKDDENSSLNHSFARTITKVVKRVYNHTHWFTDKEAWTLFRLFAFIETFGWTLLISAIIYRRFDLPLDNIFVSIAGTLHGLFFALYILFVLLTARSMMWGFWRVSGALLAAIPPYTSLLYEKIMAHHRKKHPVYIEPPRDID